MTHPTAMIALQRGERFKASRAYEVDRLPIVEVAILKALLSGFCFNPDLPEKRRDTERQRRWNDDHLEIPTMEFWKVFAKQLAGEEGRTR